MRKNFDILGIGTVSVDDSIVVENYPAPDTKIRVQHLERQLGGLTAVALLAAARLGAKCSYAGVLGRDDLSKFAIKEMQKEKINLRHLQRRDNNPAVHSFIVVDSTNHTRNVFSHRAVPYKMPANWPPREVIESARALYVDHSDLKAMIRATRIARKAGIPVIADLERNSGPEFMELIGMVDHLILPRKLAVQLSGETAPERVMKKLWEANERTFLGVTFGKQGCFFIDSANPGELKHQPIFDVEVVDTTGCGDVFHGAYAWALVKGYSPEDRIRYATGAAALQATRLGAQ
ncbi:MAG: carbohydrate kinase family protein, partial [Limisphaerales bacterium]